MAWVGALGAGGQVSVPPCSVPILIPFFSCFFPGAGYKATDFWGPGTALVRLMAVLAFGCCSG